MGRRVDLPPVEVARIARKARELSAQGITVKAIAERFGVSLRFVRDHLKKGEETA
jgi:transposase